MTLYIPLKEYSVIEFPFEIKDKKASAFYSMVKVKKKDKKVDSKKDGVKVPRFQTPIIKKKTDPKKTVKKKAPIIINVGKNNIQLYPLALGHMEFVIWGYKKFPILLKIIVDNKLGEKYYLFKDYSINKRIANKLESDSHEKIIARLTKALYNKKPPKGYTIESYYSKFKVKNFEFVLVQSYFGKRYIAEEWRVSNKSDATEKLYPEQFFNDDIYSVSFENDILNSDETTRMFIVRKFQTPPQSD